MWEIIQQLIERWGFPTGFGFWLMYTYTRELREIRKMMHQVVTVSAVILRVVDTKEAKALDEKEAE